MKKSETVIFSPRPRCLIGTKSAGGQKGSVGEDGRESGEEGEEDGKVDEGEEDDGKEDDEKDDNGTMNLWMQTRLKVPSSG